MTRGAMCLCGHSADVHYECPTCSASCCDVCNCTNFVADDEAMHDIELEAKQLEHDARRGK